MFQSSTDSNQRKKPLLAKKKHAAGSRQKVLFNLKKQEIKNKHLTWT